MAAVANQGGGTFHSASDADALLKALLEVFNEIQAVNSVFASASLPVSVNARGTYLNQVYMGMFRPDGDGQAALARQPQAVPVRPRRARQRCRWSIRPAPRR